MFAKTAIVVYVFALLCVPTFCVAQRAVFLVRHAEREQTGDALTAHGREQAEKLAILLENSGISTIFTSPLVRTKDTAEPVQRRLHDQGSDVRTIAIPLPDDLQTNPEALGNYAKAVVSKMKEEAANDIVLVVGHDVTVPAIIAALGHKNDIHIAKDEFTRLFVVIPKVDRRKVLVWFRFPTTLWCHPSHKVFQDRRKPMISIKLSKSQSPPQRKHLMGTRSNGN